MAKKNKVGIEVAAVNNTEVAANCDHLVPVVQIEEMTGQIICQKLLHYKK